MRGEPGVSPGRVLQPCGSCARLLDVTGLAVGAPARCVCSARTTVAVPSPLQLRAYTCGRCGGAFLEGARTCPWCEASLVLADRRLAGVCGRCSARLDVNASFCPGCGSAVRDQVVRPLAQEAGCPRCRAALAVRAIESREIVECTSCGGLWLTPDVFQGLCERAEEAGAWRRALVATSPPSAPVSDQHVQYLRCVTCNEFMFRRNLGPGSGLILDVCRDHGVWFDHEELVRALDYAKAGGLERGRERERARVERERESRRELSGRLPAEPQPADWGAPPHGIEDVIAEGLATLARMLFRTRA